MITSKTKVAIKAVASACALVADSAVGTGCGFPVLLFLSQRLSRHGAGDVSFACDCVYNPEQWLTARFTFSIRNELQHILFAGVVTVSEKYFNDRFLYVSLRDINLNLWDSEVGKGLECILNRVGILFFAIPSGLGCINLDGTGIVFTAKLVSETELEVSFCCSGFESTSQLLEIIATISLTVGLWVIAFRALAK